MLLRSSCFIDEAFCFSGKKQNFRSWDFHPEVPDYQDFRIIKHLIKGFLLGLSTHVLSHQDYTNMHLQTEALPTSLKLYGHV